MSATKKVFLGSIVSSATYKDLSFAGYLATENGTITKLGSREEYNSLQQSGAFTDYKTITLKADQLLIPGFVDCHTHAPQFPNLGLGLDRPLLEWLDKYTFPLESQYKDVEFAAKVYDKVVQRLLTNGTTTACYFGSLHLEGTIELAKTVLKHKQRALVGKVSMNLKNDAGYYNETAEELEQVEKFVQTILSYKDDLVQPVISPRFALSCDEPLMTGLAKIAQKYDCRTQSHISENLKEIEYVLEINPSCTSYSEVYDKSQILNNKCIMAHAIHLTDAEISLLVSRGVSLAHCPASNTRLRSGLCPVRKYRQHGLRVGLGTDVSGGDSASILDAIRRSMDVSTHLDLQAGGDHGISWKEAFYLATMGGAEALNLEDKIGNFQVGKELDALLIDVYAAGNIDRHEYSVDKTEEERITSLLQKFVYLADDRNIVQVYVKGELVKDISY
ncbi:guanine deaminase [Leguminivora glycinivorella]|uniref:guanine deaminase n=1 Tax=Leguminivora glycinivorella TaxID=1035111 RepID=UPI00200CAF5E|nr:guanine deaminase [Leguminivora glycinivorella]